MGQKEFNYIERFLEGELTSAELEEFMTRYREDTSFQHEVHAHQATRKVLQVLEKDEFRRQLHQWDQGDAGESSEPKAGGKVIKMRRKLFQYGVAATLLILILGATYVFFESPKYASSLYADLNQAEPVLIERDAIAVTEEDLLNVYSLYQREEYSEALIQAEQLLDKNGELNIDLIFLQADLYYRLGDDGEALQIYQNIMHLDEVNQWHTHRAEWNHLLILLEKRPFDPLLLRQLEKISEQGDHLYRGKAQKALEQTQNPLYRIGKFLFES